MAIVRQQRQVGIQRIGVINTDTGEANMYRNLAQAGQNLVSSALPQLKQDAQKRGVNAAKEINRQNLIQFNEKGEPKALTVPENFGSIAASAYQTVIERRFNESMTEEIQNKSNEFLIKFDDDPNGYSEQMGAYLKSMDKAAGGRFAEFISDTGSSVMADAQLKLQIAAAKKAKDSAEQTAKYNTFNALKQYKETSVSVINPESIKNVYALDQNVQSAILQEFELTGDLVQFHKNRETADLAKAAAYTNLLSNNAKNLSDSERKIVEAAIVNRSFVSQIEDPLVKNYVIKLHNLAPTNLTTLQSSFESNVDALESIASAIDDEYFTQESVIESIDDFKTTEWSSTNATLNAGERLLANAPESAKEKLQAIILSRVAQRFSVETENYFTPKTREERPEENKKRLKALEAALLSADEFSDAFNQLKDGRVKESVKRLLQEYNFDDRKLILQQIKASVVPDLEREELEFQENERELQAEKDALESESDEYVIAQSAKIQSALDLDNPTLAFELFQELQTRTLENSKELVIDNLSTPVRNNFIKLRESIDGKIEIIDRKKIQNNQIGNYSRSIQKIKKAEDFKAATPIYDAFQKELNTNPMGLSEKTIAQFRTQADSAYQKFINENEANQVKANENAAKLLKEELQDRADNGELITAEQLKNVQDKAKELTGDNVNLYNDLNSSFETSYALGYISELQKSLAELTDNKGIAPSVMRRIMIMSLDQINELKDGAVKEIATLLYNAKKPFDAKSEVRTEINQIEDVNNDMYNDFLNALERKSLIDQVNIYPLKAEPNALKVYEEEKYSSLFGVDKGQPIDFNTVQLGADPTNPTELELQIKEDLLKGIIVPSLKKYLDSAAVLGAVSNQNVFSIFQTGSDIGRYGERLNIWNRQGGNQLDPKTIARLGASMLLYEAGLAPSPEEALPRIVSNAQEVGGDITASIEKAIGKKLDTWISDTYSGADAITLERLKEAAIAIGFDTTSSKDLKRSIDSWIDVTFGTDKMVIGQRVDQDKVVGARTKYLNSSEIDKMNIAAYEAVYNSLPENDQLRLFRSRTNLELISSLVEPEIAGQKIVPQFELKFKESTAEPGIYYIYAKTDMGLIALKDERFEGNIKPPLFLDAFDFQERENPHRSYGHYYTFYRSALQHDPNGAKFGNPSWMEYVAEKLGLKEPDINYGPSQATIDAESALIFARFPERINENREEFDRLVEKGVILESDVDEFLGYLND